MIMSHCLGRYVDIQMYYADTDGLSVVEILPRYILPSIRLRRSKLHVRP